MNYAVFLRSASEEASTDNYLGRCDNSELFLRWVTQTYAETTDFSGLTNHRSKTRIAAQLIDEKANESLLKIEKLKLRPALIRHVAPQPDELGQGV